MSDVAPATRTEAYALAQEAIAGLKAAVHLLLSTAPPGGLKNAEVGRLLGIYSGHVGHEGHISRTVLGIMEAEGTVLQDQASKRWGLRTPDGIAGSIGAED